MECTKDVEPLDLCWCPECAARAVDLYIAMAPAFDEAEAKYGPLLPAGPSGVNRAFKFQFEEL